MFLMWAFYETVQNSLLSIKNVLKIPVQVILMVIFSLRIFMVQDVLEHYRCRKLFCFWDSYEIPLVVVENGVITT